MYVTGRNRRGNSFDETGKIKSPLDNLRTDRSRRGFPLVRQSADEPEASEDDAGKLAKARDSAGVGCQWA